MKPRQPCGTTCLAYDSTICREMSDCLGVRPGDCKPTPTMKPTTLPLKLPTLAAFRALPLRKRCALFLKWAKTMGEATYDSLKDGECALARFAYALGAPAGCSGGNYGFETGDADDDVQVLPRSHLSDSPIHPLDGEETNEDGTLSYAALLKRAKPYLARKSCRWNPRTETVW